MCTVSEIAKLGVGTKDIRGGGGRGAFDVEDGCPETAIYPCLWHLDSDSQRAMLVPPNAHAHPRPNSAGTSRLAIMREVEASLRRLGTDWIDLYQVHSFDATTPLEETMRALETLVQQGKVRYIGLSNFAAYILWQGSVFAKTLKYQIVRC